MPCTFKFGVFVLDLLHCMFMLLLRAVIFAFGYIFGCFHVLSLLGKLATTMANMPGFDNMWERLGCLRKVGCPPISFPRSAL